MNSSKPGTMFYFDILPALEKLPLETTGALFMAAMKYAKTGKAPDFDDAVLDFAWALIKPSIDRDGKKYEEKRVRGDWLTYCRKCKQDGIKSLDFETYRQRIDNGTLRTDTTTIPSPSPSPSSSSSPSPNMEIDSPEPQAASGPPPVCLIPLNTGKEYAVTAEQAEEWAKLYPAVDVQQQLNAMRGWCLANPQKRKTARGILQFINGWLSREQDKGRPKTLSQKQNGRYVLNDPQPTSYDLDEIRALMEKNSGG